MSAAVAVSVIVPCHDAAATIERAVASIAGQTASPIEVILVDDASRDRTVEMIDQLRQRDWPFELRTLTLAANLGPGGARNAGWETISSQSRYVAFLDADDLWLPRKLELQVAWMERHDEVSWSAHRCGVLDGERNADPVAARGRAVPLSRARLLVRNTVATPTVLVRAAVSERFRPGWRWCEDLMLWVDCIDHGWRGFLLAETLALLGRRPVTPGGATGNLAAMYDGECRVLDTLAREGRLSPWAAVAWRGFAAARYLRRRVIA